jgi:tRNA1(Val) A37 N6-methylase TrmN6
MDSGRSPSDAGKAAAHVEAGAGLEEWITCALTQLRRKGGLTVIHRADRLDQLMATLIGRAGEIVVFPLWPGDGKPAKRIIVRARKGVATPLRLLPGLVLHGTDGRYTPEAEAILRGGPLEF